MKNKPITADTTYTVFDKVQMEMPNWTGYNADLLDQLVDIGNDLIAENKKLKRVRKDLRPLVKDGIELFLSIALIAFLLGGLVFGFTWLLKSTGNYKIDVGYKAGQIDVLTGDRILYENTPRGYVLKNTNKLVRESILIKDNGKEYRFYPEE
jgi:hypothetical protein